MSGDKARAQLRGGSIVLSQASAGEIHGRFGMGEREGKEVHLSPVEAMYLVETGRLDIEGIDGLHGLLQMFHDKETVYLVYRDLRNRGFVAMPFAGPYDITIHRRGEPAEAHPSMCWVKAVPEQGPILLDELGSWIKGAQHAKKRMIVAVVDEEGDITYYEVRSLDLHGSSAIVPKRRPKERVQCLVLPERGVVSDPDAADSLHTIYFFGKRMGRLLHLSLIEVVYLEGMGVLRLIAPDGAPLDPDDLISRMEGREDGARLRMRTYATLRGRGLIPKTGFKYGVYFRAYSHHPEEEHAPYLVHAVEDDTRSTWAEVSRAVRLAHGVRKEMVFCKMGEKGDPVFYQVSRVRL
jgi:tRNA-intron endonuclease